MIRMLGPSGSRRRRRSLLGAFVSFVVLSLVIAPSAFAVHDLNFQLDGDVDSSTTTSVGSGDQLVDWDSLFDSAGDPLTLPTDFTASGFEPDFSHSTLTDGSFITSDTTTFATGSKDTLPISGWQCNFDNNVNSKIDVMNAYAAAYTDPGTGDQIVYFALERNTNTGDANVAFWFLQDEVGCSTSGPSTTFTGEHKDGDLLIVSAFTKGGDVSTIDVYRWNGGATGSLGTTPIAHGVDCRDPLTPLNDQACAAANTAGITTPWLTANFKDGVGHSLRTGEFFEGGLNLTESGLGERCFNVFIGDTRSSQSLTATLFDYARGKLGECTSETVTTPSVSGSTEIPASGTLSVTDDATVTVTGVPTFSGTVTWHLCGPFDASATDLCDTGGVAAGSQTLTDVASPQTVTSDTMTVTSAGRYCWRAEFEESSGAGIPPSSDSRESECFLVTPRTPTLTTQAGSSPVDFGNPVNDTATLGNTANEPGSGGPSGSTDGSINPATAGSKAQGTITFTLYKDDCSTLAASDVAGELNPQTVDVDGNGTYGPVSFTPNEPGDYHWVAEYDGDLPNTTVPDPYTCGSDPNEDVTVRQIPTDIMTKQSWFPNDTATITSTVSGDNLGAGGTVDFFLYDNATCSGTALYSERQTLAGGANSEEVGTNNYTGSTALDPLGDPVTPYLITTDYTDPAGSIMGPYSWLVVYTPASGDTAHTGKQSACDAENFSITYTNDPGPGTDLP